VASEPVTVTKSDVQSLEKKLLEFAEALPEAEQMYLVAMLVKGVGNPDEVAAFRMAKGGYQPPPNPGSDVLDLFVLPAQGLVDLIKKWTG
jgi:hypothetical protein